MDNELDNELKQIIEVFEAKYNDFYDHGGKYEEDVGYIGDLTFKQFQRILHILHEASGQEYDDEEWHGEHD